MQEAIAVLQAEYQRLRDRERKRRERQLVRYRVDLDAMARVHPSLSGAVPRLLTIPAIFGKAYDENFISDYLAYVLDPGKNGLGDAPLLSLLERVISPSDLPDIESVEIAREYALPGGRIDLLILINESIVVGIENKIWSPESDGQTLKYEQEIGSEFADYSRYLIYLTPAGGKAESAAFYPLSYRTLLETFRSVQYDWQADVRKSVLWKDFMTHVEVYITMDQGPTKLSEKAELYIAHHQMIEDLQGAYNNDRQRVFDYIVSSISTHLFAILGGGGWEFNTQGSREWQVIRREDWATAIEGISVGYVYFLSHDVLLSGQFSLAVDVTGYGRTWSTNPRINQFIDFVLSSNPGLLDKFASRGIACRPGERICALAWKAYEVDTDDLANIDEPFIAALKEFAFLVEPVGKALAAFTS